MIYKIYSRNQALSIDRLRELSGNIVFVHPGIHQPWSSYESLVINAIIIIAPSYIMRGYFGGIIHGDRSCCLMQQASWANEFVIAYIRVDQLSVEVLLMENSFVFNTAASLLFTFYLLFYLKHNQPSHDLSKVYYS